ncbi:hypothetical protein [Uliginosibacterium sediminicola]|uniref:Uncharacterized protein n=1 Tax=Uliginosibacterium sediminicola TaxID=2024550 RepID=A0ABU9YYC4_9RHOO
MSISAEPFHPQVPRLLSLAGAEQTTGEDQRYANEYERRKNDLREMAFIA